MAEDQKALRQQCDNLEHGITTIAGAQQTLSQDLRGFMQQMGPLISLAHQQTPSPPANGGPAPPAVPPVASPTPAVTAPLTTQPAEGGGGAAPPSGDTSMAFAPIRQPAASHGGPYSPN